MLFTIFYVIYVLMGVTTMLWCIKIACTYKDREFSDIDLFIGTLFGIVMGAVWPLAWCHIGLVAFAKSIYKKSKIKADEAVEKCREEALKFMQHEDKCGEEKKRAFSQPKDPIINLYEKDSTN